MATTTKAQAATLALSSKKSRTLAAGDKRIKCTLCSTVGVQLANGNAGGMVRHFQVKHPGKTMAVQVIS